MRSPVVGLTLAAFTVLSAIAFASCGKDNNTNYGTNPPPPGGSLELNSGTLVAGQSYQHTFATAGTYPYKCTIHTVMTGTVTVDAASAVDSALVNIVNMTATGFSPGAVTIKPGGHVRWKNAAGQPNHTVTSTQ